MTHSSFNIVNTVYTELKKRCEVAHHLGPVRCIRACPINDTKRRSAEIQIK